MFRVRLISAKKLKNQTQIALLATLIKGLCEKNRSKHVSILDGMKIEYTCKLSGFYTKRFGVQRANRQDKKRIFEGFWGAKRPIFELRKNHS